MAQVVQNDITRPAWTFIYHSLQLEEPVVHKNLSFFRSLQRWKVHKCTAGGLPQPEVYEITQCPGHQQTDLRASNFHPNKQLLECKRWVKKLSVTLSQRPAKGTVPACDLRIHFCSSGDISSLTVCASSYPSAAAFCFLEELIWEFSSSYNSSAIALVSRPYAFLEFDSVIQRVKHNFNFVDSPPIRLDPSPPPVFVKLEDVAELNGIANGHTVAHVRSAPSYRMAPVTALGILSLTLNIMCSALSLIRGVHLAEYSFQDGYENAGRVLAFLSAFAANILQCYLYLFYCPARTLKASALFLLICLCNMYLDGLRNLWQILFHVSVAFLSAQQIAARKPLARHSDCGV